MKSLKQIATLLILAAAFQGKAQITICAGSSTVLTAVNNGGLSNPSYSLNPGGITSPGPSFTVSPTSATTYTLYVTGLNNNAVLVTTSNVVTVNVNISPIYTLTSPQSFTMGCLPSAFCKLEITNASAGGAPVSYTFIPPGTPPVTSFPGALSGVNVHTATIPGIWSVGVMNNNNSCVSMSTVNITQTPVPPSATLSPASQTIGCLPSSATQVTVVPSHTNCTVSFMNPQGGSVISTGGPAFFLPTAGTYTCIVKDNANGCSVAMTFTSSTTTSNLPIFGLTSTSNFTLGCAATATTSIQIINAQSTIPPGGGPVSFSLLSPGGTLVGPSTYTIGIPGTWTVIVKDNINFCETWLPFTVQQNTVSPQLSVAVPTQTLDCTTPQTTLQGMSNSGNVSFGWSVPGSGLLPGSAIVATINVLAPTNSLVANYTLVVTDLNNQCKSSTVIPVYQNIYPPFAVAAGTVSGVCQSTVMLYHTSTSGIPVNTFPNAAPVVATLWEGPSPQAPVTMSSTYLAQTTGIYTLTALDQNNGCKGTATIYVDLAQVSSAFVHTITGAQATFNDISTGTLPGAGYLWDFGDGNTSTLQNPTHTYSNGGAYLVKLKVTNPGSFCPDSSIQAVNISGIPCVANSGFSMVPTGTAQVWNVIPNYPWNIIAAKWSWGDGSFTNTLYTSHQYAVAGMYNICLSATVSCGDTSSTCTTYSVFRSTQEAGILQVNIIPPALISGMASIDADALFSWNIFPNPNAGEFRLNLENAGTETLRMTISDLTGRIVYDQPVTPDPSQALHSCQLPPGMYLVTLEAAGTRASKRMVVYR